MLSDEEEDELSARCDERIILLERDRRLLARGERAACSSSVEEFFCLSERMC